MAERLRLKVVRGTPTAEEVAALVGVLLGRSTPPPAAPPVSRWARSSRPTTGSGGWRAAALPRG